MPEYLSPGVYVEEIDTGSKPIEGVSTSTCGVVGVCRARAGGRAGPRDQRRRVRALVRRVAARRRLRRAPDPSARHRRLLHQRGEAGVRRARAWIRPPPRPRARCSTPSGRGPRLGTAPPGGRGHGHGGRPPALLVCRARASPTATGCGSATAATPSTAGSTTRTLTAWASRSTCRWARSHPAGEAVKEAHPGRREDLRDLDGRGRGAGAVASRGPPRTSPAVFPPGTVVEDRRRGDG